MQSNRLAEDGIASKSENSGVESVIGFDDRQKLARLSSVPMIFLGTNRFEKIFLGNWKLDEFGCAGFQQDTGLVQFPNLFVGEGLH